jgi:hypothetical protein
MATVVDPFIQAVDEARRNLIREEGANVSIRELIRRAGYTEQQRPGIAYHLNPNRHSGERPHHIPRHMVERFARALRVPEEDLARAAAAAAGHNVVERDVPDVVYSVTRFYGDEQVTDEERAAATARILQIIADAQTPRASGTDTPGG